jgi:outer membrane lipoprotein LolB
LRRLATVACALVLGACASVPAPVAVPEPATDAPFDVSGRLSARRGTEGVAAHFTWEHAPGRDEIALATPMGTTLATLTRDAGGASIVMADGEKVHAPDAASLAARAIGVPLPVEHLAWWIRGMPREGSPHAIERDAAGRASVLRQDGWSIVYAYADGGARASRLSATYPDVEVRVVIDAWR